MKYQYHGCKFKVLKDEHIEELETNLKLIKPRYPEYHAGTDAFIWQLDQILDDYDKQQKARRKAGVETVKEQIKNLEQAKSKLDRAVKGIDEIKKMQGILNGIKTDYAVLIEPKTYKHLIDAVDETKADIDRRIKKINAEKIGYYKKWDYFDNTGKKLRKPVYKYQLFKITNTGKIIPDWKVLEESIERPGKKPMKAKQYYYDLIETIGTCFLLEYERPAGAEDGNFPKIIEICFKASNEINLSKCFPKVAINEIVQARFSKKKHDAMFKK